MTKVLSIIALTGLVLSCVSSQIATSSGPGQDEDKQRPIFIGLAATDPEESVLAALGLEESKGVFVTNIIYGAPPMLAGIKPGDLIVTSDGFELPNYAEGVKIMRQGKAPGDTITLTLLRNYKTQPVDLVLGEWIGGEEWGLSMRKHTWPGFEIVDTSFSDVNTVQISVLLKDSIAAVAGLQEGDMIVKMNDRRITGVYEFYDNLNVEKADVLRLEILRDQAKHTIVFEKDDEMMFMDKEIEPSGEYRETVRSIRKEDLLILAVMDFEAENITASNKKAVMDIVTNSIFMTRRYRVIERHQRNLLLSEMEISQTDAFDEAKSLEIGKLLAADKIVIGSITQIDGRYLITLRLIDVESGETEAMTQTIYEKLSQMLFDSSKLANTLTNP